MLLGQVIARYSPKIYFHFKLLIVKNGLLSCKLNLVWYLIASWFERHMYDVFKNSFIRVGSISRFLLNAEQGNINNPIDKYNFGAGSVKN